MNWQVYDEGCASSSPGLSARMAEVFLALYGLVRLL
jgi:hypothetical protein